MLVTQAALPFLEASKGAVVNMSGVAAHRPFTSMLPYCCAKYDPAGPPAIFLPDWKNMSM